MGSIRGHYEWDDDGLTPGNKREGGLHQNLFDGNGKLKGSARFIPEEGDERSETVTVTETIYVTVEERRRTQAEEDIEQIVSAVVNALIDRGLDWARPVLAEWWNETAKPLAAARRDKIRAAWSRRRTGRAVDEPETDPGVVEAARTTERSNRPSMSVAEAQSRLLAALAARAYGDEQMALVAGADIVGGADLEQLERSLQELPPDQLRQLIRGLATNPALLTEDSLADLASILDAPLHRELGSRDNRG